MIKFNDMTSISLRDFIQYGRFGNIELGSTIDSAMNLLGPPEARNDYDDNASEILYAWYEIFYNRKSRIIYGIQNDHLATFPNTKTGRVNNKKDICYKSDFFEIDIWFLKKNIYLTYGEVTKKFMQEDIEFSIEERFGEKFIQFPSKVKMYFNNLSRTFYHDTVTGIHSQPEAILNQDLKILSGIAIWDSELMCQQPLT